ncbi:MAG: sulfurtransferase TusA family protein [Thermoplasmata archaeon]
MDVEGCFLPEDRLYDLDAGVWLKTEGEADAALGLMASFASFVGRVLAVTYRPPGIPIERGRSVAMLESLRFTGPVRTPVPGTVTEQNPALRSTPKLINNAPYDQGWIVRLRLAEPGATSPTLEPAVVVEPLLREQIRTQRIRCFPAVPDGELIEIGAECAAILARLDEELAPRAPGDVLLLVTDDPTSPIEMVRWSDRTGNEVLHHRTEGNLHQFLVRRAREPKDRSTRR